MTASNQRDRVQAYWLAVREDLSVDLGASKQIGKNEFIQCWTGRFFVANGTLSIQE